MRFLTTTFALACLASVSMAQTVRYATGFESPFSNGSIKNQQTWDLDTQISNPFKITAAQGRNGTQGVIYDLKLQTDGVGARTAWKPDTDTNTQDTFVSTVWVKIDTDTRSGNLNRGHFGLETYGDYIELFPGIGFYQIGAAVKITGDGRAILDRPDQQVSAVVTNVPRDTWHRLELIQGVGNQIGRIRGSVNGIDLGILGTTTRNNFAYTALYASSIGTSPSTPSTNIGHYDDLSVKRYATTQQTYAGRIAVAGYAGNLATMPVSVVFDNGGPVTVNTTMDKDGYFEAKAPVAGLNRIFAKTRAGLQKLVGEYQSGAFVRIAPVTLINGDINNDNFVDFFDYLILSDGYESEAGQPGYDANPYADLNGDGVIDFFDYLILNANYELQGDEPTPGA